MTPLSAIFTRLSIYHPRTPTTTHWYRRRSRRSRTFRPLHRIALTVLRPGPSRGVPDVNGDVATSCVEPGACRSIASTRPIRPPNRSLSALVPANKSAIPPTLIFALAQGSQVKSLTLLNPSCPPCILPACSRRAPSAQPPYLLPHPVTSTPLLNQHAGVECHSRGVLPARRRVMTGKRRADPTGGPWSRG